MLKCFHYNINTETEITSGPLDEVTAVVDSALWCWLAPEFDQPGENRVTRDKLNLNRPVRAAMVWITSFSGLPYDSACGRTPDSPNVLRCPIAALLSAMG